MEEIWKDIVDFEGLYKISNYGRVKSLERIIFNDYNKKRLIKERIMSNLDLVGYKRIELCREGKIFAYRIHRLVAIAFIPNPNNYKEVNHIDGNPSNNRVDNLEWCSSKQNKDHAYDNDLTTRNKKVKLIKIINNQEYSFRSLTKAGEFLGRNHDYIRQCIANNRDIENIYGEKYIVKR